MVDPDREGRLAMRYHGKHRSGAAKDPFKKHFPERKMASTAAARSTPIEP